MTIEQIIIKIKDQSQPSEIKLIHQAYDFAKRYHGGKKILTGEPYIQHSLHTAFILAQLGADTSTIIAGLLNGISNNLDYPVVEIRKEFGEDVTFLVESVAKLNLINYRGQERYRESLKKMFLAIAKDLRISLIKFADRLHDLRTLEYLPDEKRQKIARETMEIYVPIAGLLGIWHLKWQMEDICFRFLYPKEYEEISHKYEVEKKVELDQYIEKVSQELSQGLAKLKIEHEINGRFKHLYSIWTKMNNKNRRFDEIYDVFALRVIVPTVDDCYRSLGVIHNIWRPNLCRFKDYIAIPKPNGYQSLHTTVFGIDGKATEFQIRTQQMHAQAQYGVAAHWSYKQYGSEKPAPQLNWTKEILNLQKSSPDTQDFIKNIQLDLFKDQIFILTPRGDVYELPIGATPVDFAYALHTDIGNKTSGVLINNKIGKLDTPLDNSDIVEIIIDKKQVGPNQDWLKFVKTSKARNSIKQYAPKSTLQKLSSLQGLRNFWNKIKEPRK
ncbi:MAG TPA: RelA/SpoT family protein [bacterium]|nr:RelA/SpoT family protein [bacterium]